MSNYDPEAGFFGSFGSHLTKGVANLTGNGEGLQETNWKQWLAMGLTLGGIMAIMSMFFDTLKGWWDDLGIFGQLIVGAIVAFAVLKMTGVWDGTSNLIQGKTWKGEEKVTENGSPSNPVVEQVIDIENIREDTHFIKVKRPVGLDTAQFHQMLVQKLTEADLKIADYLDDNRTTDDINDDFFLQPLPEKVVKSVKEAGTKSQ